MNLNNPASPAAYMTLPAFCKAHGFKAYAVRRAVNTGLLPVYQPFGARQYLRVDEALAFIAACRKGGAQSAASLAKMPPPTVRPASP